MFRSNKPEIKKEVKEKEDLNEEQLDIKKYLGIWFILIIYIK